MDGVAIGVGRMALPLNEMGKSSSAANCGAGIRSPAWTGEDIQVETWSGQVPT